MDNEIIKPSYIKNPDYITGKKDEAEAYNFTCLTFEETLQLNYKRQIENSWTGKGPNLSEEEYLQLRQHYHIGVANKSKEGGFPVFDKIICKTCNAEYFTYIGIDEPLNSMYQIQVQGIMRNASKNVDKL
ncbi:hypothetical protein FF125_06785 [Aureibaculum algae]|uniref:Uncharacterized protein n=1 Tax=Aureibaculum algae TaxID=2584122 RepID=A0A5B7TT53_9FLAO|nr:hypothetical protein [Aureibaculum algae]QCX38147.1 hypothetical protein FF125_06785 [Aureibaculum algae]